jgi:hypothetical protein
MAKKDHRGHEFRPAARADDLVRETERNTSSPNTDAIAVLTEVTQPFSIDEGTVSPTPAADPLDGDYDVNRG